MKILTFGNVGIPFRLNGRGGILKHKEPLKTGAKIEFNESNRVMKNIPESIGCYILLSQV